MTDTENDTSKVPELIYRYWLAGDWHYAIRSQCIEAEVATIKTMTPYILKSVADKKIGEAYGKGYNDGNDTKYIKELEQEIVDLKLEIKDLENRGD